MSSIKRCVALIFTVIALSVLALPVKAEEKVWYCEMTGFATTTVSGEKTFKLEKFKMKVTKQNIEFGSGGYFNGDKIPIIEWYAENLWRARDRYTTVNFTEGQLHYGMPGLKNSTAISARCDDF